MPDAVDDERDPLGWWTISGTDLLKALRSVEMGSSAGDVFDELYMASHHEFPEEG